MSSLFLVSVFHDTVSMSACSHEQFESSSPLHLANRFLHVIEHRNAWVTTSLKMKNAWRLLFFLKIVGHIFVRESLS